jgi:hypothetical protein
MSQWTHVNGIIRVDALRMMGPGQTINIGTPSFWEDEHQAKDIPTGSEGSLHAEIWENPSQSSMSAYTVSIFGDLRDYSDKEEIIAYLNQITEGQMIRSGICEIQIEYNTATILHYDIDKNSWSIVYEKTNDN